MVEFLTPKRNSFVNKTVGVVSTNTGGAEVGRAIEQAGARATQMFYEEAVKDFDEAIRLNPEYYESWNYRGDSKGQ